MRPFSLRVNAGTSGVARIATWVDTDPVTGTPSPARLNGAELPPSAVTMASSYPKHNPGGEVTAHARFGIEAMWGLPSSDPWIVAAAMAGGAYIDYIADEAFGHGKISEEQLRAVELVTQIAGNHWRAVLIELGAVPAPAGYFKEETN